MGSPRRHSCPPDSGDVEASPRLLHLRKVSLIHVLGLPTIPSPPTCVSTTSLSHATPQLVALPPVLRESGLRTFTRRDADHTGRIEFLIVRTGRSPPVASHPVSRRRSYSWLQAGERMPEEDLHLSDQACSKSHECGGLPPLAAAEHEASFQAPKREQATALQRPRPDADRVAASFDSNY